MDKPVQLQDMTSDDLGEVWSIEQQVQGYPWTHGMFAESLAQNHLCKVLRLDGGIAGYVILMQVLDEMHLLNIAIAREYQHKGFGVKILSIINMICNNLEISRILLEVRMSNMPALALYGKAGYSEIGRRRHYYVAGQQREDAIVMECRLK